MPSSWGWSETPSPPILPTDSPSNWPMESPAWQKVSGTIRLWGSNYVTDSPLAGYWEAAFRKHHPDARFFLFSDEPDWARELFKDRLGIIEVIDHNRGAESYNDLRLMSRCKHNILANSTFSWWAAWLRDGPEKLVIAPQRWLIPAGLDADMIPSRWTRI